MDGEIHRKESKVGIIVEPENYAEMKEKYLAREQEKKQKVLESWAATNKEAVSESELQELASKAIVQRALRAASEHKTLKDRTILREPKSEEILDLKKKLNEEITAIGQRILSDLPKEMVPSLAQKGILKGRISQNRS